MAISSAECRKMIDACKRANVHLMIAYRVHYDATFKQIRDMVRSGQLGEIQTILGGFYGQKKAGEWRLNRALAGGGSLLDLGIYPLNAARWIVGEEPSDFRAFVSTREKGPRFAQVEQTVQWVMKFPSGILFNGGSSYTFSGSTTHGKVSGGHPVTGQYDQFTAEADHFAACIRNNTTPDTAGDEGLADMLAMEAIYRAAGAPIA
jgi:predicted dehydrogenase